MFPGSGFFVVDGHKLRKKLRAANSSMGVRSRICCFLLALWIAQPGLAANETALPDLIIRNVHVVNPSSGSINTLVNLRISDGALRMISEDVIPGDEGSQILDAGGGFLLGNLALGGQPRFMILDGNPLDDIKILLDTRKHVVFAVDGQAVLTNTLAAVQTPEPPPKTESNRWLAYDPPPYALPSSITSGKWNSWQTKWTDGVFISGMMLDRQYLNQDEISVGQFGDLSSELERGTIRGWRFGVAGTINFERPWVYNIGGAWNSFDLGFDVDQDDSEFQFFDVAVDIPVSEYVIARVGKQKEPISMDRSMSMADLPSQERSAVADGMFAARNVGVTLYGYIPAQRVAWSAGLFNDWLVEGEDLEDSATQGIGRVSWVPFLSADEVTLLHLGFGVRYTDAKQGVAFGSRPEIGNSPRFVEAGPLQADSATLYNAEIGWRSGPYWLMAEYADTQVDAPDIQDPNFTGYHLSGTWSLSGEMRSYRMNRGVFGGLPVAHGVYDGGFGALELGLRYSSLDLTDGTVQGGEMDVTTLQLNWWPTSSMLVSLNYKHTVTDRFNVVGEMDAVVARIGLILQ